MAINSPFGDCAEIHYADGRKALDQLWYTGKMQGRQLVNNISTKQKEEYKKPIYYNSAKFFDVEYQVYGEVSLKNENDKHLYWESSDRRECVRIAVSYTHLTLPTTPYV